jgi:hypothetical protein
VGASAMSPPPPEHDVIAAWADQAAGVGGPTHPRRCGRCRQVGHICTHCPHTAQEARRLAAEHVQSQRAVRRDQVQAVRDELFERNLELARERGRAFELHSRVVELQGVVEGLAERPDRPQGPSRLAVAMQEIIFENAEKIPDGIYKQMMDVLMIRD